MEEEAEEPKKEEEEKKEVIQPLKVELSSSRALVPWNGGRLDSRNEPLISAPEDEGS